MRLTRLVLFLLLTSVTLMPARPAQAEAPRDLRVAMVTGSVVRTLERALPFAARNVAVYWDGHADAQVTIAFSRDGKRFGEAIDVGRDEMGANRNDGRTYGAMLTTLDAAVVRVRSSEPIKRLTVLGVRDRVRNVVARLLPGDPPAGPVAGAPRPPIASRNDWSADESLRFNADGTEKWTPTFAPITKLIVHHTDTTNNDANPAATVRAIYHYHAITQRWGDIGYNFLIDGSGRIYKGRNSHPPRSNADSVTGQDPQGNGVVAAHALGHNRGTVGVALLGTLTSRDATPAARESLERLLAWVADQNDIDPYGASPYTSSSGAQSSFANIAGHRDTGRATQCPGDTFHRSLPQLRSAVAARMTR
ncbi:MAG: peptidoglycan recognition family protein [Acidimicrobiales bacterium]|nr:peptidoglycan recognition family protein [Acidimicrobiales bacterium]